MNRFPGSFLFLSPLLLQHLHTTNLTPHFTVMPKNHPHRTLSIITTHNCHVSVSIHASVCYVFASELLCAIVCKDNASVALLRPGHKDVLSRYLIISTDSKDPRHRIVVSSAIVWTIQ
jgi:hypothetical protein